MNLVSIFLSETLLAAGFASLAAGTFATAATVPPVTDLSQTGGAAVFSGNLSADNDVAYYRLNLDGIRHLVVTFETLSYAGGNLHDGQHVARGGFDPMVSIFDGYGRLIDYNDDSYEASTRIDPVTSLRADSHLEMRLHPGAYTVAVSQFFNYADRGIQDGFGASDENYTYAFGGCSNGRFCDVSGANRTSDYTMQVSVAPVPLPAALPLLGSAIGVLGAFGFRRRWRALS